MGSQFVDLNADGHLDYLTATFAGSPYVSYGSKDGFQAPEVLKDVNGERIILTGYWDDEQGEHLDDGRAMPGGKSLDLRCTSALAFDWDNDGDYDLVLGSYEGGHLYLQMNEGTSSEAKFTGKNIAILANGKPLVLGQNLTTPKLVDWDGDGDMDLLLGSYEQELPIKIDQMVPDSISGGVYISLNEGKIGNPKFTKLKAIIAPQEPIDGPAPVRPETGLYPAVVDFDNDGDLDLLIGGYLMFTPEPKPLSKKQQKKAESIQLSLSTIEKEIELLNGKLGSENDEKTLAELNDKYAERWELEDKLDKFIPSSKRESFVWYYERL